MRLNRTARQRLLVPVTITAALVALGILGRMDAQDEARASALYCEGAITWAEEAARGVPPEQRIGQPDYRGIADEHCPGYRAAAQRWNEGGRQLASY